VHSKAHIRVAALAAALHLLVFTSAPLLHTCRLAGGGAAPHRVGASGAPLAYPPSCRCPCGVACAGYATRATDAPQKAGAALAAGPAARSDAACLACIYAQSTQSGHPSEPVKPISAPARAALIRPELSDVSPWLVLFDYPARAPPAVA